MVKKSKEILVLVENAWGTLGRKGYNPVYIGLSSIVYTWIEIVQINIQLKMPKKWGISS